MSPDPGSFTAVESAALVAEVRSLREAGWRLVQIGAAALPTAMEVIYSFDLGGKITNRRVSLPVEGPHRLPSITSVYAAAALYENELHDLFRIQVEGNILDFKGKFYRTTVPFPFASRPSAPAPAAKAGTNP